MNEKMLHAGESWTRDITVWADDEETVREDLTGATGAFQILDKPGGDVLLVGSLDITDPEQGELTVVMANTQTDDYPESVLYWLVRLNLSGSRVADVDSGRLIIRA